MPFLFSNYLITNVFPLIVITNLNTLKVLYFRFTPITSIPFVSRTKYFNYIVGQTAIKCFFALEIFDTSFILNDIV